MSLDVTWKLDEIMHRACMSQIYKKNLSMINDSSRYSDLVRHNRVEKNIVPNRLKVLITRRKSSGTILNDVRNFCIPRQPYEKENPKRRNVTYLLTIQQPIIQPKKSSCSITNVIDKHSFTLIPTKENLPLGSIKEESP
jgi:hypothetical protein